MDYVASVANSEVELYLAIIAAVSAVAIKLIEAWRDKRSNSDEPTERRRKSRSDQTDPDADGE